MYGTIAYSLWYAVSRTALHVRTRTDAWNLLRRPLGRNIKIDDQRHFHQEEEIDFNSYTILTIGRALTCFSPL